MIIALVMAALVAEPPAPAGPGRAPAAVLTRMELAGMVGAPSPASQTVWAGAYGDAARTAEIAARNHDYAGRLGVWATSADTGQGSLLQSAAAVHVTLVVQRPR